VTFENDDGVFPLHRHIVGEACARTQHPCPHVGLEPHQKHS